MFAAQLPDTKLGPPWPLVLRENNFCSKNLKNKFRSFPVSFPVSSTSEGLWKEETAGPIYTHTKQGNRVRWSAKICAVVLRAVRRAARCVPCLQTLHKQIRTMTLLQHRATEARPSSSGVRARARGIIEQAGNWPCKLSSLSACGVQPCKKDAGLEGLEMLQRRKNDYLCVAEGGPSPTSVTDAAAWEVIPRSALSLDSVAAALQGSSTSHYLSQGEGIETAGMCHQTNTRYGGGMFASLKGAHNTWQGHTECDASNTRQRHALAMALARGAHDSEAVDSREQIELKGKKEEEEK